MYTVSQCDIFKVSEMPYNEMVKKSTFDHFWVIGDDVTMIPERADIQRTATPEIRLFRDSSSNTVSGALMNRNIRKMNIERDDFSESTFKGSAFMNIGTRVSFPIVIAGNTDIDVENHVIRVDSMDDIYELLPSIATEYFYLVPDNFVISDFFEFDCRITNIIDCHYRWVGEVNGSLTHDCSIRLMNKNLLMNKPSNFLRFDGFIDLPGFSGSAES